MSNKAKGNVSEKKVKRLTGLVTYGKNKSKRRLHKSAIFSYPGPVGFEDQENNDENKDRKLTFTYLI